MPGFEDVEALDMLGCLTIVELFTAVSALYSRKRTRRFIANGGAWSLLLSRDERDDSGQVRGESAAFGCTRH